MPIERRTASRQTTTLVFSVVALLIAVVLVVLVVRSAGKADDVTVRGKQTRFDAGLAADRAESIRKDGPFLLSDVSGGGQRLPVYISHLGDDDTLGWNVIGAHPPGAPDDCFITWTASKDRFTSSCSAATYPAGGGSLPHYGWSVTGDGRLLIDLRSPTTTSTTTTSTTTTTGSTTVSSTTEEGP